jgi:signal peptidase I
MSIYHGLCFFLFVQIGSLLERYEAAGRKRWEAAIPIYNAIVLMKIIGRHLVTLLLLFQL